MVKASWHLFVVYKKNSFCTFVLKALWALLVVYYYFTLKMSSWGQKCGFCFCLELFSQKKKSCLLRLLLIWMVIYLYLFCVILLWRGRLIHRFSSPYENFSWIVLKHEFETVWISFFFFARCRVRIIWWILRNLFEMTKRTHTLTSLSVCGM